MVACFLFILTVPVWALYLSYFKREKIRKNLRRSWYVISSDGSVGWDPISRSWAIRAVIGAFAFPAHSIKHGRLSAENYAEFSKILKFILKSLGVCSVVWVLGSCILLVIGDLVGVAGCGWFLD